MDLRSRTAPVLCAALMLAAVSSAIGGVAAQATEGKPSSGLINPRAIAYSPLTHKVYAVDSSHGAVAVYNDSLQTTQSVQVGSEPISVAVDSKTGRAYVANAGDGTVSVLDGATDKVLASIPVGSHPYSIAADSITNKIYITHTFGNQLTIIDGATEKATDLKTGSSDLIAVDAKSNIVYLLGYGSAVKRLDAASMTLTEHAVGRHAWGLALNDATGAVYATRIEDADIAMLDGMSAQPAVFSAGAIPCAIAVDTKTNTLYVANSGDNTVTVVDGNTGKTNATVKVGDRPESIAYDSSRNAVYVANTLGDSVTVIDAASNTVIATLPAGKSPYALAVVPGSNHLYVADASDKRSSTVVDLSHVTRKPQ